MSSLASPHLWTDRQTKKAARNWDGLGCGSDGGCQTSFRLVVLGHQRRDQLITLQFTRHRPCIKQHPKSVIRLDGLIPSVLVFCAGSPVQFVVTCISRCFFSRFESLIAHRKTGRPRPLQGTRPLVLSVLRLRSVLLLYQRAIALLGILQASAVSGQSQHLSEVRTEQEPATYLTMQHFMPQTFATDRVSWISLRSVPPGFPPRSQTS